MTEQSLKKRLESVSHRSTLKITTIGRKSGKKHSVTIWFVVDGKTVYLATLNVKRDWVRNVEKNSQVELDIGETVFRGEARRLTEPVRIQQVQTLLSKKYWLAWIGSWVGFVPDGSFVVAIKG